MAEAGNLLEGRPLAGKGLQAGGFDALQRCAGHALRVLGIHARQQIRQEQAEGARLLRLIRDCSRLVEERGACMDAAVMFGSYLGCQMYRLVHQMVLAACTMMLTAVRSTKAGHREDGYMQRQIPDTCNGLPLRQGRVERKLLTIVTQGGHCRLAHQDVVGIYITCMSTDPFLAVCSCPSTV